MLGLAGALVGWGGAGWVLGGEERGGVGEGSLVGAGGGSGRVGWGACTDPLRVKSVDEVVLIVVVGLARTCSTILLMSAMLAEMGLSSLGLT